MLAVKKREVLLILSVCLALVIQHAMHTRHIFICGLRLYDIFPHYLIKSTIKKNTEHDICILIFSVTFEKKNSHYKKNWARYDTNVYRSSCKYLLFSFGFNETWILSTYFQKIHKYQISWKSVQGKANFSMRTDGQTDRYD